MFLQQGCRHRRKGKRLYKGTCLEKQAGAQGLSACPFYPYWYGNSSYVLEIEAGCISFSIQPGLTSQYSLD
jgi:hypothetical protein